MDLPRVARDVEAAAADLERLDADVDWETHRHVAGQTMMREIEAESATPLRDALATWVAWLTVARVSRPAAARAAKARADALATVRLERDARVNLHDAIAGVLRARTPGEARAYFAALPDFREPLEEPERTLREVRAEAFRRLGIEDVAARFVGVKAIDLALAARQFLAKTHDLARELAVRKSEWPFAIDARLARAATEGWPSRLSWRTAAALLPGFEMRGVIANEPPLALGAASFARALRSIGETFHALPTTHDPFAVRVPPLFPDAHRMGLVFASILADKSFHARVLGASPGRAADQARVLGVAFLLDARFAAARVALRSADPEEVAVEREYEPALAGVWPALRDEDLARFVAMLALLPMRDALHAREGDDWFRNPRAFATLRDLATDRLAFAKDAETALARRFEEALA